MPCGRASTRGWTTSTRSTSTTPAAASTPSPSSASTSACSGRASSATRTRPTRRPTRTTRLAEEARAAVLAFLNASPDEYDVVFTANASAALRLVGEAYPFDAGSRLLLTADNHNSVNGIREFARARGATVDLRRRSTTPDLRVDDAVLARELDGRAGRRRDTCSPIRRSPTTRASAIRSSGSRRRSARGWDVLLDAAAFVPANRLDLSTWHPDFVAISWYKVFGYPTGIGSLVVRREALARLRRPWFAGGTIGVASVVVPRHTLGEGHVGFEDGTVDYLGLPGITIGLRYVESIGLDDDPPPRPVPDPPPAARARRPAPRRWGAGDPPLRTRRRRRSRRHDRVQRARPRGAASSATGTWRRAAGEARISIRAGCFCNPGASEAARGITAEDMTRVFALGHQPRPDELEAILPGKALGAVRVSVGIATTERDVEPVPGVPRERRRARLTAESPTPP